MKRLSIAALCLTALAVSASPAAAEYGQLLPGKLPTAQVREGTSQLQYRVNVPCQKNKRLVGQFFHWNVCDYKIKLQSGTALVGPGGDAYTFQRQFESTTTNGESVLLDVKVVDDRLRESPETMFVDMKTEVRECHAWAKNPIYPNCNFRTNIRGWWQGQIRILDNDLVIASPVVVPGMRITDVIGK
jgi:hypothetical protein